MGFLKKQQHKYCPVCGNQLRLDDSYCTRCGYSFVQRKAGSKKIKWKRLLLLLVLIALIYFGFRYANSQPIIPLSWQDALNFTR